VTVAADSGNGGIREFKARVRLDTPQESEYFRHGGILQYVLRLLLEEA
jgi:aconitate hydratase